MPRAIKSFRLSRSERNMLSSILDFRKRGSARRIDVVLALDEGLSIRRVQEQTSMSRRCILHWKRTWQQRGLYGLALDAPRSGRPKILTQKKQRAILAAIEHRRQPLVSQRSTRELARKFGVSHVTIMRVLHTGGVQPRRMLRYASSMGPNFQVKNKDILAVSLGKVDAAVLFVEEEVLGQPRDPTQEVVPKGSEKPELRSVEFASRGTMSLLTALDLHTQQGGFLLRPDELVVFLDEIATHNQHVTLHVLLNRLTTQEKHVIYTCADKHSRIQLHFRRANVSWLTEFDAWLSLANSDYLRGNAYPPVVVANVVHRVMTFVRRIDRNSMNFGWTYRHPRTRSVVVPLN
jgi:transposase